MSEVTGLMDKLLALAHEAAGTGRRDCKGLAVVLFAAAFALRNDLSGDHLLFDHFIEHVAAWMHAVDDQMKASRAQDN